MTIGIYRGTVFNVIDRDRGINEAKTFLGAGYAVAVAINTESDSSDGRAVNTILM